MNDFTEQNEREQNHASDPHAKIKMTLIPVLVACLGGVIWMRMQPDTPTLSPKQITSTSPHTLEEVSIQVAHPANSPSRILPELSINQIASYDPFQSLSLSAPAPLATSSQISGDSQVSNRRSPHMEVRDLEGQKEVDDLKQQLQSLVVDAILISGKKKAAMINSKIYHEGDQLHQGIYIHEITPSEVTLHIAKRRNNGENSQSKEVILIK